MSVGGPRAAILPNEAILLMRQAGRTGGNERMSVDPEGHAHRHKIGNWTRGHTGSPQRRILYLPGRGQQPVVYVRRKPGRPAGPPIGLTPIFHLGYKRLNSTKTGT